jgi:hypothetical protein
MEKRVKNYLFIFHKREKASVHELGTGICQRVQQAAAAHTSRSFHLDDSIRDNAVRGKKRKIRKLCEVCGSLQFLCIENVKTSAFFLLSYSSTIMYQK